MTKIERALQAYKFGSEKFRDDRGCELADAAMVELKELERSIKEITTALEIAKTYGDFSRVNKWMDQRSKGGF